MSQPLTLHPERLFPADPASRAIAARLYAAVRELPIISPHGHTDPAWFATDAPFANPTELLLAPDHYVFRMLYSQGLDLDALGVPSRSGRSRTDPRAACSSASTSRCCPPPKRPTTPWRTTPRSAPAAGPAA
jgi:glucuronate isomerase